MDKQVKEYFDRKEKATVESLLESEIKYRTISTKVMAESKPNDNLLSGQNQALRSKELFETELRHVRSLRKEVDDGNFQV